MSNKKENLKSTHTESSNDSSIFGLVCKLGIDLVESYYHKKHVNSSEELGQRSVAMFVRLGCVKIVPSVETIKCQCCKKKHSDEQLSCPFILKMTGEKCYCNCCSECYNECADSV